MIDDRKFNKFKTEREFCEWMALDIGVDAVPGTAFFKESIND
jgi:hypothetical protein